jgi:CDP-4-dehydro-6-deoxyglucose reductase
MSEFRVIIEPSQHSFKVRDGETVLQSALDAGFVLPYGCRDGACGSCKGKLLDGNVDYGKYQPNALSEQEKRIGYALFCCARPLSDLTIECREISALKDVQVRQMPCRVQKIEKAAPDVAVVTLKLPANDRLQFLAGQYLDFMLKDGHRRSFSIATPPHAVDQAGELELHLRHMPGGHFTGYVFSGMKEREILRFEAPLGTFFLREDSEKPIVFVASGTGFAPIKAMLEHAFHHGIDDKRALVLYWGARARRDLYLDALPRQWAAAHPRFSYVPVLSDPEEGDRWQGRTGLVHQAAMDDFPDLSGYQVYACGNPLMVEAAKRDFISLRALPQEEFFADSFTIAAASETAACAFRGNPASPAPTG